MDPQKAAIMLVWPPLKPMFAPTKLSKPSRPLSTTQCSPPPSVAFSTLQAENQQWHRRRLPFRHTKGCGLPRCTSLKRMDRQSEPAMSRRLALSIYTLQAGAPSSCGFEGGRNKRKGLGRRLFSFPSPFAARVAGLDGPCDPKALEECHHNGCTHHGGSNPKEVPFASRYQFSGSSI